MSRTIIFTDLDGTLLDRHSYSWAAAADAVNRLKAEHVPIVFCSSKTRAEQSYYQSQLGIQLPMIVENGSAIILPQRYFSEQILPEHSPLNGDLAIVIGCSSKSIREKLHQIRERTLLDFRGYSEMSDQEMTKLTGLRGDDLERARQREYSETIVATFSDADWATFRESLARKDLAGISGGHLFTVTSSDSSKDRAVRKLIDLYRKQFGSITTIGLGDSPNDRDMLAIMDVAYQVQRPDGTWYDMQLPDIRRVGIGPAGWQEAILSIMASRAN